MGKLLSDAEIKAYHDKGYHFPIRVFSDAEVAGYRRKLEAIEVERGGPLKGELKQKPHLIMTWADEIIRHPKILDPVEDIIGPNILCWASSFFTKEAKDPAFISYHQDLTYWGLEPADIITAWVALSPATIESGCMKFVPESHKHEVLPHNDTFAEQNLLSRGQEVAVEVDEDEAAHVILQPGEMSLHHVKLVHGSEPNRSDDRRIGFAIRYVPTYVRQVVGAKDSAVLVRGTDSYNNFEHDPSPTSDFDPAAMAHHHAVLNRIGDVLYRDTGAQRYR